MHRGGAGSTPAVSTLASVVSTASTRPLYGRGAGSNPAGGSLHTLVAQRIESAALRRRRTLVRIQPGVLPRGRSSEGRAPGRHPGEARSIRVVRFTGPWCKRQHGELQPRWSGFDAWRACLTNEIVAGRGGSVTSWAKRPSGLRFDSASRPHFTTATYLPATGQNSSGYRLLIETGRGFESRLGAPRAR